MLNSWYGIATASVVALTGCATDRTAKPLLTANASNGIAKQCGAVRSEYHRDKPKLPYATFTLKADEVFPEDGVSPTIRCIGKELDSYQHAMFSFRPDAALPD